MSIGRGVASGGSRGRASAPLEIWESIPIRGADYAHHFTACPSGFENISTPLKCISIMAIRVWSFQAGGTKLKDFCIRINQNQKSNLAIRNILVALKLFLNAKRGREGQKLPILSQHSLWTAPWSWNFSTQ